MKNAGPIEGVIAAAVTPRRAGETSIDLAATLEMIDFLCTGGVSAIVLLGSTGEFVHFALDDRRHMTTFAIRRSRVPVLVNVSHSTLDGAIDLTRDAAESGAAGVLLMPPHYFHYDSEFIRTYYLKFVEAVGGDIPVYIYNIPQFADVLSPELAADLLGSGAFAGIKDSSPSLDFMKDLAARTPGRSFQFFTGNDAAYRQARALGATGIISGVASALPELLVALDKAVAAGDSPRAEAYEARLQEFLEKIRPFPVPFAIKEACQVRGLHIGCCSTPPGPAGERRLREFAAWFEQWLPEVEAEWHGRKARGGR